ncbi:hypothetical protein LWI28_011814 [Acer negundo]|uniref:Plasma membrane ATPase n=1 Tax=Acer negundo TaxID=4023 RepID=A0AAD5IQT7_ACENE|nr:hypothetical protein LWI28_011814 [Acer negundo]
MFETLNKDNPDMNIRVLTSIVLRNIGVYGPDHTLHRAKRFALKIGDEKSYNKLYRHGGIIIERNPGSNAKLSMISYHLLLTLMQNVRRNFMKRMQDRYEVAMSWEGNIPHKINELLGSVAIVPCKHAMACITRIRQNVEDYMHEYIKKPAYLKIYSNSIHAIPDESLWPEVEHGTVLPPLRRRRSSRPRLSRRRGITEPSRVKRSIGFICSKCQKVLTAIGNFCICSIALGMVIEIIVIYGIQHRAYRVGIDNLLVLLIGGIPIAMPTVLSITMAIGSHRLSQQGAITKRMTAIEEMAGMDVLCSDKTGTLTLNKLTVDKNMIEVFAKGVDKDTVVLMAARASRLENQDAIDGAIVAMLSDPKEILYLAHNKSEIEKKAHAIIDKFAERGLRSLGVARQFLSYHQVPAGTKDSPGGPWEFVGLLPLFDPPRHDSAGTIRRALDLGVSVKMITGDQLAIGKETGRRLGMGTNMYPSSALLGESKDEASSALLVDDLIEKADGFAGVFPEHKYEIVRRLQARKHICGMTGDGVNDAPALKKADIGIAVADSTDAARSASDIVLTEPGLSVIISAVLTSRAIFQRMKNYTNLYTVHRTASDSANIKDKTEEVDNKDYEAVKPNGHPPKVNECVN